MQELVVILPADSTTADRYDSSENVQNDMIRRKNPTEDRYDSSQHAITD